MLLEGDLKALLKDERKVSILVVMENALGGNQMSAEELKSVSILVVMENALGERGFTLFYNKEKQSQSLL